ncbi:hypothetical protein [Streptomyces sp. NBC_01363]|uniref:hypothetical protein n=1 Tax=Streptomyces sp. NBC_01363 TaxID=2903840 RepID=UPI002252B725|nr:hypothetical protein [Streptomyces sp. NBC_01363]MCX4731977.1 hypothetical protein [Streptomyces sp. NBC_01363]
MPQLRNAQGPGRRLIGRTLLASALLTAAAAVPAVAQAPHAPAAPASVRSDVGAPAYQQVAHFYGAYIDAVTAEDGGRLATALRTFYLTPHLRSQLNTWEQRNHADGVLRAQNTPLAFRVTPGDSAAGHTWSTVRLTWSEGKHPTYSYLTVRSDLRTGKISGIGE